MSGMSILQKENLGRRENQFVKRCSLGSRSPPTLALFALDMPISYLPTYLPMYQPTTCRRREVLTFLPVSPALQLALLSLKLKPHPLSSSSTHSPIFPNPWHHLVLVVRHLLHYGGLHCCSRTSLITLSSGRSISFHIRHVPILTSHVNVFQFSAVPELILGFVPMHVFRRTMLQLHWRNSCLRSAKIVVSLSFCSSQLYAWLCESEVRVSVARVCRNAFWCGDDDDDDAC